MDLYASRYVVPVASPVVEDGAVAVRDRKIVGLGRRAALLEQFGDEAHVHDLGESVVLPGLVNAHAHLELSWMGDVGLPRGDFVGWLRALVERREAGEPPDAREAAERELHSAVSRGTVAIGDVSNGTWIGPMIARSPLHGIVFHEVYGVDGAAAESTLREAVERLEELGRDADLSAAAGRVRLALTPHAPHTTSVPLLRALAGRSAAAGEPLTIHVAESAEEVSLLADGSGRLLDLFRERGLCNEGWTPPGRTPVEHLMRLGVLSSRAIAVHCVHLDQQDHSILQSTRATVVTCPRSNAALGVGKAPIPALLREGIPVALGTDSLASVPDVDLFAEIATLRETHPALSAAAVVRMATLNGARALGLADRLGSIEPGKLAELIVVPLEADEDQPLELVCARPAKVYRLEDAARELAETPS